MTRLKIAHIREQGANMIIVPMESHFGRKSQFDQNSIISELQARSLSAGLAGRVIPVWDSGGGRMAFIAPENWHGFFRSISLPFVWRNINKELSW